MSEPWRPSATAQLPLRLRYSPDQRFDGFVGAPLGTLEQLRALTGGSGDWLYLAGPSGSGKTHLALAACAAAEEAGRSASYLPLMAAVGRLRDALEALEGHDLIALDGLEALAGHRNDEIALFDFHNRARAAGRSALLYTATMAPDALPLELPDLRSRLGQCARIVLPSLDDAARAQILRGRAQRRGLTLDDAAIGWLLTRTGRDINGLLATLEVLDRESLAAKRQITVPFLRRVLGADQSSD